jgi:hypothetical protein
LRIVIHIAFLQKRHELFLETSFAMVPGLRLDVCNRVWQNDRAMEITYELTQKDFTEAFSAHRNRRAIIKWIRTIIFWVVILGLAFLLFGAIRSGNTRTLLPSFAVIALWLLLLTGLPLWLSARRQFLKQPGARGPRTVMFDGTGAHWRWNGGSSDIEWKNYVRSVEGPNQFLLYTSPACFNIIPKRAIEEPKLSEVRSLLEQNIPPGR